METSVRDGGAQRPVLVLGLGNILLTDDGVGARLLEGLRKARPPDPNVEYVDGGTQGLALLGRLAGRRALLILDAVALGAAPGTVHELPDATSFAGPRGAGAHEGNAADLLLAARLLGDCPPCVALIGIEPGTLRTGIGLTAEVERALPAAVKAATLMLARLPGSEKAGEVPCTS